MSVKVLFVYYFVSFCLQLGCLVTHTGVLKLDPDGDKDFVYLDDVPHHKITNETCPKLLKEYLNIENEFRKLLSMEEYSYVYKRGYIWRTWRRNSNQTQRVIPYKYHNVYKKKRNDIGYWTIDPRPPMCSFEIISMPKAETFCIANITHLSKLISMENLTSACPKTKHESDFTGQCDNPIVTKYKFTRKKKNITNSATISEGLDNFDLTTTYKIDTKYVSFQINSTNETIYSKIMTCDGFIYVIIPKYYNMGGTNDKNNQIREGNRCNDDIFHTSNNNYTTPNPLNHFGTNSEVETENATESVVDNQVYEYYDDDDGSNLNDTTNSSTPTIEAASTSNKQTTLHEETPRTTTDKLADSLIVRVYDDDNIEILDEGNPTLLMTTEFFKMEGDISKDKEKSLNEPSRLEHEYNTLGKMVDVPIKAATSEVNSKKVTVMSPCMKLAIMGEMQKLDEEEDAYYDYH